MKIFVIGGGGREHALIWKLSQNPDIKQIYVAPGNGGMDEIATTGTTEVTALEDGKIRSFQLSPADFGLPTVRLEDLKGGDGKANADALRAVLAGAKNAYRDISLANAAAALVISGKASTIADGMKLATASLENGDATAALERLIAVSND